MEKKFMQKLIRTLLLSSFFMTGLYAVAQQPEAIIQKEEIRRQEILLSSTMELNRAQKLIQKGKAEEAKIIIRDILARVPESGKGEPIHVKARQLLSELELQSAESAAKGNDWFTAMERAQKALEIAPENKRAEMLIREARRQLGVGPSGEINPAVDRKFVSDYHDTKRLYKRAEDFFATGQYDEATKELQKLIKIDPYNTTAAKLLKKVQTRKFVAADAERLLTREQLITENRENWTEQLTTDLKEKDTVTRVVPIAARNEFAIQEKLKKIIIPKVEFNNASINDAVRFLTAKTRELDQDGVGVSFLIQNDEVIPQSKNFSLNLNNVPAAEVLRYVTNLAGVKSKVEEFAVFIVPLAFSDAVILTRDFPVRATFFDVETPTTTPTDTRDRRRPTTVAGPTASSDGIRAKEALEAMGVTFGANTTAIYSKATGILTVKNSQDQIDLIEELITGDQGETLMVRVETKFVEINQTDLEELTPQFNLQGSYNVVTPSPANFDLSTAQISVTNGLQGARNLRSSDGINRILNTGQNPTAPQNVVAQQNQIGLTTAIDGNRFAALINALNQKSSTDVMTAPSIVVIDGAQATMSAAREFSFPTEYEAAQTATASGITAVAPSFPTDFEEKNIGVTMTVKPQITVDRQRVVVTLRPELVEFDGFINYGNPVNSVLTGQLISANLINQPVFSTRTVEEAKVEIQDGYTMILGGLIREDISTVEERIPLLGDLPFVGRAFRSKAEQAIKKNLLIFVTVRILRPDGEPYNQVVDSAPITAQTP
ncbi:MAG: hypothetical protein ACFCUX_01910 [Candidatus Methylacidiphilales bacterium]